MQLTIQTEGSPGFQAPRKYRMRHREEADAIGVVSLGVSDFFAVIVEFGFARVRRDAGRTNTLKSEISETIRNSNSNDLDNAYTHRDVV
jgi:hypothetical protein